MKIILQFADKEFTAIHWKAFSRIILYCEHTKVGEAKISKDGRIKTIDDFGKTVFCPLPCMDFKNDRFAARRSAVYLARAYLNKAA